jgi:F-type H+-transporting ATPase subunit a
VSHGVALTPDQIVYVSWGFAHLNATVVFTWAVDLLLLVVAWRVTRRLSDGLDLSHGQNVLEVLVESIQSQLREIMRREPDRYVPFLAGLFLFVLVSNVLAIVPGYQPPTGSLSTTAALAICVFVAVPVFGIAEQGWGYFAQYVQPTPFMLPFNVLGELSRTLALAVRLFGNIMSGTLVAATVLALAPLFVPIVMHALGLLTGVIQAYIFAVLAAVYIASGLRAHEEKRPPAPDTTGASSHD